MTSSNRDCTSCPTAEALATVLDMLAEVTEYALEHPQAPAAALMDYAQGYAPDALRMFSTLLPCRDHGQVVQDD